MSPWIIPSAFARVVITAVLAFAMARMGFNVLGTGAERRLGDE